MVFLTLNNHIGLISKTTNKTFINCSETYPLYLNNDFCILFNNQFFFNNKLNEFLKKINKEDVVIMFGDTPPLFVRKDRTHFKDLVDVYVFNKK